MAVAVAVAAVVAVVAVVVVVVVGLWGFTVVVLFRSSVVWSFVSFRKLICCVWCFLIFSFQFAGYLVFLWFWCAFLSVAGLPGLLDSCTSGSLPLRRKEALVKESPKASTKTTNKSPKFSFVVLWIKPQLPSFCLNKTLTRNTPTSNKHIRFHHQTSSPIWTCLEVAALWQAGSHLHLFSFRAEFHEVGQGSPGYRAEANWAWPPWLVFV